MRPRGETDGGIACLLLLGVVCGGIWYGYQTWQQRQHAEAAEKQALVDEIAKLKNAEAERKAKEMQQQYRLATCLDSAKERYWAYIKLNGREDKKKPGTWWAADRIWDSAAANKRNDIEECNLLYGQK